ncbi:MAG: VWA domain-containing protein [Acidobacteria bacterium]|nr:MAG: VWA domain-containing protein [Acidobacteriota bacterium]
MDGEAAGGGAEPPAALVVSVAAEGGGPVDAVEAGELRVLEDGRPAAVLEVVPVGEAARRPSPAARRAGGPGAVPVWPWRLVVYADAVLLPWRSRFRASEALARHALELTALGTVEVVVAAPQPEEWLGATRDPKLVADVLRRLARETLDASPELASIRRAFAGAHQGPDGGFNEGDAATLRRAIAAAATAEQRLVEKRLQTLADWLAMQPGDPPRALLWLADGYDLDPAAFYAGPLSRPDLRRRVEDELLAIDLTPATEELAARLAHGGWTAVPIAARARANARDPGPSLQAPLAPLERFSDWTGGRLATRMADLDEVLHDLGRRWLVRYRPPPEGGEVRRVAVRSSRPGRVVRAPLERSRERISAAGARALSLLRGGVEAADLELDCSLEPPAVEGLYQLEAPAGWRLLDLDCRLGVGAEELEPGKSSLPLALALAVETAGGGVSLESEEIVRPEARRRRPAGSDRRRLPIRRRLLLPADVRRLGVVARSLASGRWGGALLELPPDEDPGAGEARRSPVVDLTALGLDAEQAVYLAPIEQPMVTGRTRVQALALRPEVARVRFLIDERAAARDDRPPFEVWLNLPELPAPAVIRAVAEDAEGRRLGSDSLAINQGQSRFAVRILEPRELLGGGSHEVVVGIEVPKWRRVERVELFWREERLASFERPPYRARIEVPQDARTGFLRAVARLDDGSTREDVLVMGAAGFSEEVGVDLVELPVVVEDRWGRPIAHLEGEDFTILEDGVEQRLVDLRGAGESPLALALALDVSASMAADLPLVRAAASGFLRRILRPQDRALLVAFSSQVTLLAPLTDDVDRLTDTIERLVPDDVTALNDAILFSLVQLHGIPGRKAVVLLTDGRDVASRHSRDAAFTFARHAGIPIYVIGLGSIEHKPVARRSMARLARATGGALHLIDRPSELEATYRTIADELAAQYLLSYYSSQPASEHGWRRIEVEVGDAALRARTISGYLPGP